MAKAYQKYLRKGIDLSPLGIERRGADEATYFCTPRGASLIGWTGVDGIHYCFIRGFGEMVFSVSPMNTYPHYVHPVAENFTDFLRLLLACNGEAALEQAWMWDKETFEKFLRDNPATKEQEAAIAEISAAMDLTPMPQPWEYIRALQSSFDYSKIKYTEDFYDPDMHPAIWENEVMDAEDSQDPHPCPEWKVWFDGGFWGHQGKDRAGKELLIEKTFSWAGRIWRIPAIYVCGKGLVVDFCMRVEAEEIRAFSEKWKLSSETEWGTFLTRDQQMQIEIDNPMSLDFSPRLLLNGATLSMSHGCFLSCTSGMLDGTADGLEEKWVARHYNLDPAYGWQISRYAFPWSGKRRPKLKTLSLTMEQQPVAIPGPHFHVHVPGDVFSFTHPVTKENYTLTVQEIRRETLPKGSFDSGSFGSDRWEYPENFQTMVYTLEPEAPQGMLQITDSGDGDSPKEIASTPDGPQSTPFVGIIGGACRPAVLYYGAKSSEKNVQVACSSLHFTPVSDVQWQVIFHLKQFDNLTVPIPADFSSL